MKMKRFAIIALLIILSVVMVLGLASCKKDPAPTPTPNPTPTPTLNDFTGITFTDASYPYDGEAKTIEINGQLPEGATVTYAPANSFTNPGKYSVEAKVSCQGYNDLTIVATLTIVGEEEVTTAEVTFNSNGGPNLADGQQVTVTVAIGSAVTAPTTPMFRTGYTFSGWYANGVKWNFSDPVNADLTLTAEWDLTQYTVNYHTGVGAVNPNEFYSYNFQSETYELLAPTPADGNPETFAYWYVMSGTDEVKITSIEKGSTGNLDIYAKFNYTDYKINYVMNAYGAVNPVTNPVSSNIGKDKALLYDPSAVGYTFLGWYSDPSLSDEFAIDYIPASIRAEYNVYAKWEATVYDIVFEGLNSSEMPDLVNYTVEDDIVLPTIENRPGFNFVGWKDAAGNAVTKIEPGNTGTLTFVAQWSSATYTIEYDLAGGTAPEVANPTTYTLDTETFSLNAPTRAHYTFVKWVDEEGNAVTEIVKGSYANIKLAAVWKIVEYTVTYEGLSETKATNSDLNPTTINAENYTTFTLASPFAPGYTFEGWFDAAEGGNAVTSFSKIAETTVYARFTKHDYKVTYKLYDGINHPDNIHGFDAGDEPFTLKPASKPGYTFIGWFKSATSETEITEIGGEANITVHARFEHGTEGLVYELTNDQTAYIVTGYTGDESYVAIPATYKGLPVVRIDTNAFLNNEVMTSVEISSGIKEIGNGAFNNTKLTTIVIPASVSVIEQFAFYDTDIETIYCCVQNKPAGYATDWDMKVKYPDDTIIYHNVEFGYGTEIILPTQPV